MEGDTIHVFTATGFEKEGTESILSYRNNHGILSFPSGEDTVALFTGILPCQYREPSGWAGDGLAGYLHYTADGTGGNIVWSIAIERIGDNYQNIDTDSFGAETTITSGAPSASGDVLICNTSVLNLDGMVVGDAFRLRITREGTNENDTCEATAQFLAIELREI